MKSLLKLLAAVAVTILCLTLSGCGTYKDLKITSCRIVSLTPNGMRSVDVLLEATVHNPSLSFTLKDIGGCIKIDGRPYMELSAEDVSVKQHSDCTVTLPCSGTLSADVSLYDLLMLARGLDMDSVTVDIHCVARNRMGIVKKIDCKDCKVSELMKKI